MALMLRLEMLLGQIFLAREIDGEADQHADAGGAEAVMPAINFAKRADDQRRGDHAGVDAEIEDLEGVGAAVVLGRSEEHTSELQSLMRISYAVFCLKKKKHKQQ